MMLAKIWKWFRLSVMPTVAIFVIWLVAMIIVVVLFGFIFNRYVTEAEKVIDDTVLNNRERRISKALLATVIAVTALCLVAILVRVGWIAMLIALIGMVAVLVIAYNMVD